MARVLKNSFSRTEESTGRASGTLALREGAQPAISAGMPIEFRTLADYGHTLMVGVQLPIAVQWLFEH